MAGVSIWSQHVRPRLPSIDVFPPIDASCSYRSSTIPAPYFPYRSTTPFSSVKPALRIANHQHMKRRSIGMKDLLVSKRSRTTAPTIISKKKKTMKTVLLPLSVSPNVKLIPLWCRVDQKTGVAVTKLEKDDRIAIRARKNWRKISLFLRSIQRFKSHLGQDSIAAKSLLGLSSQAVLFTEGKMRK